MTDLAAPDNAVARDALDEALVGTLNDVQRACVTNVSGPLLVSAGAGSGKTFMLTRRIAYALLHPELSGVRDVDQDVLAITFTELAAAEIKARVRSTLRSIGMVDAALKVDSSWISTIHGMCSRILHEHALELGLDPAFSLLDDTDRDNLLLESVNEAVAEVRMARSENDGGAQTQGREASEDDSVEDEDSGGFEQQDEGATYAAGFGRLFSEYGAESVKSMVLDLINEASNVQGGLDAVRRGPSPASPREIARDVYEAMARMEGAAHLLGINVKGKQDTFAAKALDALVGNPGGLELFERLSSRGDVSYEDVATALDAFNPRFIGNSVGRSDEKKAAYASWLLDYDKACSECIAGLSDAALDELLSLTRLAQRMFEAKKAQRGCLDQNDLLLTTLRAFQNNDRIAAQFRNKFKLVMVDEFQDTSALQIAIISYLDGNNDEHLCTVGDTQQSIYRFRGADVDTYRAHKRHMRDEVGAQCRELGVNYRSHGDVITFVNRLFSQDRVFGKGAGSEFIELEFNPARPSSIPQGCPRIDATFVVSRFSSKGHPAPNSSERLAVEARVICDRFLAYHEAGIPWKDMVVLLGVMSNADVYAGELRAHGIPCVIAGGSIFSRAAEARLVCSLARCVADPLDDEALVDVLTGDMFGLDPDELLLAASDENGRRRGHLWHGLLRFADDAPTPRLHLAARTLKNAVSGASALRPSTVLTDAVVESGWLDRLYEAGPEGTAQAANVLKAIRLAETLESDPHVPRGAASVADRMSTKFAEGMKEAPGALNTKGNDAVRIMTIHASKGLEFPVVALGDFWKQGTDRDVLKTETIGEAIHLYLNPGRSLKKGTGRFGKLKERMLKEDDREKQLSRLAGFDDERAARVDADEARSVADYRRAIREHAAAGELAELRRKFYVGATRPREALVIVCQTSQKKENLLGSPEAQGTFGEKPELLEDLAQALYASGSPLADAPEGIEFGGSMRAICRKIQLEIDGDAFQQTGQRRVHLVGKPLSDYLLSDELGVEAYRAEAAMGAAGGYAPANPLGNGPLMPTTLGDYEQHAAAGDRSRGEEEAGLVRIPEPIDVRSLLPLQVPCDPDRAGTFSYSSIAHAKSACDPDEAPEPVEPALLVGDPEAEVVGTAAAPRQAGGAADPTAFGSAFHTAAQWMAEMGIEQGRLPDPPDRERLVQIARTWGVGDAELPRLQEALDRWHASDAARQAYAHARIEPEAPFFVTLLGPQGEPLHLEGSIDLLCSAGGDRERQRALVVDYKTGGSPAETPERLLEKHLLQAECYAYAVLLQGYAGVDLVFVRVEVADGAAEGQPQTVRYSFDAAQRDKLAETIRDAYRSGHAKSI